MSVQTISDIIVTQQFQTSELQLSGQPQISLQKSENSTSFADLVSFYQEESKTTEAPKNETAKVEDVKSENKEEKTEPTEAKTESPETEKTDKTVKEEKTEKSVKEEKVEKTENSDKSEKKIAKSEKTTEKKSEVKEKDQKIKVEDYSKMNEIAASAQKTVEVAVDVKNQKSEEVELKIDSDVSEKNLDLVQNLESNIQLAQLESENSGEMEGDSKDFAETLEFVQKKSDKVALDKEGKITVEDLRTEKTAETEENQPKLKTELKINDENTATITMDYVQNVNNDVLSLNNQTAASNGSNYQQMLNNQIQMNAPEFVKAGNIVLKDNNQGTINLVLHPDDLGNVKIHLSLDGKTISGHIQVSSKEALQVFKDNSETLREAFIKSGFDAANFDVSYGGNNNGFANGSEFNQRNDGLELFGKKMYNSVAVIDAGEGEFIQNSVNSDNFSVNIVA